MQLTRLKDHWDRLAQDDPLWAVLTDPEKRGRRWNPDEFFSSGVQEIGSVMETARSLGLPREKRDALDFGCGVGRLTQPLTAYFDRVVGVDISASMLSAARKFNQHPDRCSFVLNTTDDLSAFGDQSFDLIYSNIVLQHVGTRHARRYLREFCRILRPDGLVLVQLPSHLRAESLLSRCGYRWNRWRRKWLREPGFMDMSGVPRETVLRDIDSKGARLLQSSEDHSAGPEWVSYVYAITR